MRIEQKKDEEMEGEPYSSMRSESPSARLRRILSELQERE
jgi:hypothetical protein